MPKKALGWVKRYLPAEISDAVFGIIFALITFSITNNRPLTALMTLIGEIVGFYSYMAIQELLINKNRFKNKSNLILFLLTFRNLILEFGTAEIIDFLFVRPFLVYFIPIYLGNLVLGVLVAKILADIIYYLPTIISFELRKKYLK